MLPARCPLRYPRRGWAFDQPSVSSIDATKSAWQEYACVFPGPALRLDSAIRSAFGGLRMNVIGRLSAVAGRLVMTLACMSVLGAGLAAAQEDASGSRDHPLVKRYDGAVIIGYETRAFDEYDVAIGPHRSNDRLLTERRTVEGAVTRIIYVAPEGRSSLEVIRNYQRALAADGFRILFECRADECGIAGGAPLITRALYPRDRKLSNRGQVTEFAFSQPRDVRYFSAQLDRPEGAVFVSVAVAIEGFDNFRQTANRALVLLDVVETGELEERMVVVEAAEMAREIASTGRVALYGILFDTDSVAIKAESDPAIEQIAALLGADSALKLFVVGHTDSQGGYDYNLDLSRRRAEAVMATLVQKHGIAGDRLRAAGVGFLAPVASNETAEGRELNRRVELVRQ